MILLIGDGMGLAQVSMLQIEQQYAPTAFDRAEGVALITTRSANNRVTDSAAAGTALATGHKTDNGMLGQTPDGEPVQSMIARAHAEGRPTGLAVCCYLQHATPAAFYAHVADRGDNPAITRDLASSGIDVLFGGGRKWLGEASPEGGSWLDAMRRDGYAVAETMDEAERADALPLLAVVAEESVLDDDMEAGYLTRATRKSLELLSAEAERRDKGFVLMVEGSFIDCEKSAALLENARKLLSEFEVKILGYYLDGLTCREIAETVGRSPKSVDNAVQRLRLKIARQLLSGDISNG